MTRVIIVQRILSKYRVPFFEELRRCLIKDNIKFEFIHGIGNAEDQKRGYVGSLPWAKVISERYFSFGKTGFVFQPYGKYLKDADLVIVQQEMRWLLNYWLLLSPNRPFKLAFWGHGYNHQAPLNSFDNKIKKVFLKKVDWWFAYTQGVAGWIKAQGFSPEQVSVVQNSIDTRKMQSIMDGVSSAEIAAFRKRNNIDGAAKVGLFCSGMYPEKRLDFLLEACREVKNKIPSFHMIFIGAGPQEGIAKRACAQTPWMHYLGPQYEREKILAFLASDIMLMPGLVGLNILDCFVAGIPLITTAYPYHSPEIEYLVSGVNGAITENDLSAYTDAVAGLLENTGKLDLLKRGCAVSAQQYSMENMVANFHKGIQDCLDFQG